MEEKDLEKDLKKSTKNIKRCVRKINQRKWIGRGVEEKI